MATPSLEGTSEEMGIGDGGADLTGKQVGFPSICTHCAYTALHIYAADYKNMRPLQEDYIVRDRGMKKTR